MARKRYKTQKIAIVSGEVPFAEVWVGSPAAQMGYKRISSKRESHHTADRVSHNKIRLDSHGWKSRQNLSGIPSFLCSEVETIYVVNDLAQCMSANL